MATEKIHLSESGLYRAEQEWHITPTPEPGTVVISEYIHGTRTVSYMATVDKLPQWARESIALVDVAGGSLPGVGFKHPAGVSYYLEYKGYEEINLD